MLIVNFRIYDSILRTGIEFNYIVKDVLCPAQMVPYLPMMSMHLSSQIDLSEIMYKSLRWKCSDAKLMRDCKFVFPNDQHTDKHLPTYIQKQ